MISHSSSDLLKICVKMGASWSAQDFRQAGVTPSGPGNFFRLIYTSASAICLSLYAIGCASAFIYASTSFFAST